MGNAPVFEYDLLLVYPILIDQCTELFNILNFFDLEYISGCIPEWNF